MQKDKDKNNSLKHNNKYVSSNNLDKFRLLDLVLQ